jgi:glycosyltransferase involved in cell wall biosynthesis
MEINITYAITVCNELAEITTLVNFLHPRVKSNDEILIQYDSDSATKEVIDYLKIIEQLHTNVNVINFPLNKDFASFKNNLKNHANGIFIFQIDADEVPHEYLITNMHELIEANLDIDLFFVPRVNTVKGLTDEHIKKWGWNVSDEGWVNWPDLQTRIYRRTSEIEWEGKVHERIKGYNTLTLLPLEEPFAIYHPKEIERQEKQNELYDTI